MTEFHFLRPFWFFALFPLAALIWLQFRRGRRGGDWESICDHKLLPHLLITDRVGQASRFMLFFCGLGGLLAILALAGPVWERLPAPVFRNDAALVIALDLSRSMDAADIKPSRLERARYKIADILKQRKDGLTALLVYSGDAFTVTPLTDDGQTINAQLSALSSDLMPAQGSRADLALQLAERLLKQAGLTRGDVLLVTSGVNLTKAEPAAQRLGGEGYRVSVLGTGGSEGAPIPLPEGGFLEDTQGNIVISKLAGPALQQLANGGGGRYQSLTADNSDLTVLLPFFAKPVEGDGLAADSQARIELWQEPGPWLLLLLLPIAALAFRRGYLAALLFLFVLPLPEPVQALEWQDLWRTPDQQARQAFESGDPAGAAEKFRRPDWKAAAQYKADRFDDAVKTLDGLETPDAQYNLGNALARMGRYQEAIQSYDRELARNPDHEDARHNKELVEKALQKQQKQKEKQEKQDQNQDGSQEDKSQQGQGSKPPEPGQEGQDQKKSPEPSAPEEEKAGKDESAGEKDEGKREGTSQEQQNDKPEPGQAREQDKPDATEQAEQKGDTEKRPSEEQQASEQWLRRIPDDPGGLLKRKFYYQYQQRQGQNRGRQP